MQLDILYKGVLIYLCRKTINLIDILSLVLENRMMDEKR